LRVRIAGDWPEVIGLLRVDFGWWEQPRSDGAAVEVELARRPPRYERHAAAEATFVTPRNAVFREDGLAVIDYWGRALAVLDRARDRIGIEGEDAGLVHEAAYHFVLSRVGEHLDRRGLVRLHGLGLSGEPGATIVMLPSGGGKTTLALAALEDGAGLRLLSEDSPLLDRRGRAHPFPLRIGVNEADANRIPADFPRQRVERMEFHPKVLVPVSAFADRLERSPQPVANIVIGRRSLGPAGGLTRIGRREALGTLLREGIVGVGIYQGMEFVLQRGMRDALGQAGVGVSRTAACLAALSRARVWRLECGRDAEASWGALRALAMG
jgi:hypothetical protein